MKITKSKIDVYKIRQPDGFGWADIAIDAGWLESSRDKQNCFRISISSDYGNWAFFWSHPGKCWRKFLISIDMHYAANKFDASKWFDIEATARHLKAAIARKERARGEVTKAAREAFSEIELAEEEYHNSKDLFFRHLAESEWQEYWGEYWLDQLEMITSVDPRFNTFWREIWPAFTDELKSEIESLAA